MPKRCGWTPEQLAEIRRLRRCLFTNAEIGERFGVSGNSIAYVVRTRGLVTPEEANEQKSARMRGKPLPERSKRKMAKARREQWRTDPKFITRRAEASARFSAGYAKEIGDRGRLTQRGGIVVPEHMQADWRNLIYVKKLNSREAGAILGLVERGA